MDPTHPNDPPAPGLRSQASVPVVAPAGTLPRETQPNARWEGVARDRGTGEGQNASIA